MCLILAFLGSVLGSFAGASVWRIRAQQLAYDKKNGEKVSSKEFSHLKKLLGNSTLNDRSSCLNCSYRLKWYDLIPIFSWLSLKGRCRSCNKPIGRFELIIELSMAVFFVASYIFWPLPLDTAIGVVHFVLWLIAGVTLSIQFAYDSKWFLLPDRLALVLVAIGLAITSIIATQSADPLGVVGSAIGAIAILAGLYLIVYIISDGKWIGFGDVKLGVGLGLLLADWKLALSALILANFVGLLAVLPSLIAGQVDRKTQIPFGPFLIIGTVLAWFIGNPIIDWYLGLLG